MSIWLRVAIDAKNISSFPHSARKSLEDGFGSLPVDAGVCDADTVYETSFALRRDFLCSWISDLALRLILDKKTYPR